jgi:hypothetical protein
MKIFPAGIVNAFINDDEPKIILDIFNAVNRGYVDV